jgi:hypothetical protein
MLFQWRSVAILMVATTPEHNAGVMNCIYDVKSLIITNSFFIFTSLLSRLQWCFYSTLKHEEEVLNYMDLSFVGNRDPTLT